MNYIIMIGGPNGAGTTTVARTSLPRVLGLLEFVNADNIALGLSPFNPQGVAVAAGRVMLERMRELARDGTSFELETTRAGRGHARFLKERQEEGAGASRWYLFGSTTWRSRCSGWQRVMQGGHNIPPEVIRRRYWAGLRNMLRLYFPMADTAQIYDNRLGSFVLIAEKTPATGVAVHDESRWARLKGSIDEGHDGS